MSKEYTRAQSILGNIPEHGQIMCYDDMEGLLKWQTAGTGGDTVFEIDTNRAYHKSKSLHLKTRTTGTADNDNIHAIRGVYFLPSLRINAAFLFHCPDWSKIEFAVFSFRLFDGTNFLTAALRYDAPNTKFQIIDETAVWTDIPDAVIDLEDISPDGPLAWHILSFAANLSTPKYINCFINQHAFTLSAFTPRSAASAVKPMLDTDVILNTIGAAPCELFIDSFLLNEL